MASNCNPSVITAPLGISATGPRSVIVIADPPIWDESKSYEYLTLVATEDFGQSYISKKDVPSGTSLENTDYWLPVAQFNAQVAYLQKELSELASKIDELSGSIDSNASNLKMYSPDMVSVEFYGAVGDGLTDDTQAIQNAISSGRAAYLSEGKVYLVTSPLTVNGGQRIVCDGYIKASPSFAGGAVVVIGKKSAPSGTNVLSMATGLRMRLKVDCGWANCDGVHISSSFGNSYDVVVKNFNSKALYTGVPAEDGYEYQHAENVISLHCDNGTSSEVATKTGTIGAYVRANDDVFTQLTTANVCTALDISAYCEFGYIHGWISIDELFSGSVLIRSANGKFTVANSAYCDGMETALSLSGASAASRVDVIINPAPQSQSKEVKPVSYTGGNYDSGPYDDGEYTFRTIDNSPVTIRASDYGGGFIGAKVNGKNVHWVSDDGSMGKIFQTDGVIVGSKNIGSGLTEAYLPSGTTPTTFFLAKCARALSEAPVALVTLAAQNGMVYVASQRSDGGDPGYNFVTANWKAV